MNIAVRIRGGGRQAKALAGRRGWRRPRAGIGVLVLLVVPATGCHSLLNSWLDPSAVGDFANERTLDIRTSLSIQDSPLGIAGATEPGPEDLVPDTRTYRFVAGDTVAVRIFELMARGTETTAQALLDEAGEIRLPVIGTIVAAGLTAREFEEEIIDYLAQNDLIHDAQVIVEPLIRRDATYVVFGTTTGSNVYPLPTPSFRLLEALSVSGGLADVVTDIYVFRTEPVPHPAPSGQIVPSPNDEAVESEEGAPVHLSGGLGDAAVAAGGVYSSPRASGSREDRPATVPASQPGPGVSDADARRELIDSIAPSQTRPAQVPATESRPSEVEAETAQSQWIFLNGDWIEVKPEVAGRGKTASGPAPPAEEPIIRFPQFPRPAIDWEEIAGEEQHRIIRVSAEALRSGDARQNIVVRAGDTLRLMAGEPGEYYMMGQINRPGVYGFGGRRLTLKGAIAAAGGLGPLVWPERCTVYRRLGDREEMIQVNVDRIFAGEDADFYIKKDDLVLFGTHPVSIFLAVVRSAFRVSYGFGFVYDRNFADVDITRHQVAAQQKAVRDAQPRFPGLFP